MNRLTAFIRTYPLTVLMIISCLVGGPYFGGKIIYEKIDAWQHQVLSVNILDKVAGMPLYTSPFMAADAQRTREQQVAEEKARKKKENPFSKVKQNYLDDAVFIGDSRTDTLNLYAGWDNATFYCKTGTNIWAILDDLAATDPKSGETISIDEGLQKNKFGKVYIMLGVNELGTGTAETYYQQFKKVVDRIKELQPDAIIFVESIIHVADFADDEGGYVNNKAINERNSWLKKLADNEKVFYIDANEVLDDEDGALHSDWTFDGIHLKAENIKPWKQYILAHGVVKDE